MQKNKYVKIAVILAGAAILTAGIIMTVFFLSKKTDSYRSILIYQLEGKAEIEREGTGTITAANNLYLESGDKVKVDHDSSMRLRLDDDKYILVEEDSVLSIQAEGSDKDSKTSINLEQGAITNEIQNKLTETSTYEVNSPNSIMAVRGTIFRAEGYIDEDGKNCTKISTFDGTVGFQPLSQDGTKQEEVLIEEGKEAVIQSTSDGIQYLKEPSDITFSDLPLQALYFLQDLMENDAPVTGITPDELQKLIQESENSNRTNPDSDAETDTDNNESSGQNSTAEPDLTEPDSYEPESADEPSSDQQSFDNNNSSGQSSPTRTPSTQSSPTKTPSGQSSPTETPSIQSSPTKTPSGQSSPTKTPSGQSSPTRTPSGQSSPTKTPSGQSSPTVTPSGQEKYTVTFMYQGKIFGVQTVENGQTASKPKLNPAPKGKWDFDFSQTITKNVVINWISE